MPSGHFRASNQYSYLPHIGLSYAIGQAFVYIQGYRNKFAKQIKNFSFLALTVFFIFISYRVTIRVETWRDSISLYNDIIKKKPQYSLAYKNRGNAKLFKGNLKGAFSDYELAYKFNPKDIGPISNMGYIRMREKRNSEAFYYFNKAITLDSTLSMAYNNRAILLYQLGDTINAVKDWQKAASLGCKEAVDVLKTEFPQYAQNEYIKTINFRK